MASAPLELAWLYHEFCKVLVDIRRFDLARFYAKKGCDVAQEARCDQWYLNIYHLLLRMEIHQNNRNEAREAAIVARETARKLGIDCLVKIKSCTIPRTYTRITVSSNRSRICSTRSIHIYIRARSHIIFKISWHARTDRASKKYRRLKPTWRSPPAVFVALTLIFPLLRAIRAFVISIF